MRFAVRWGESKEARPCLASGSAGHIYDARKAINAISIRGLGEVIGKAKWLRWKVAEHIRDTRERPS